MEHPCPEKWDYENHPKRKALLGARVATVLTGLRSKKTRPKDLGAVATDTRRLHRELFRDLTPPHFPHYAGHYRGELLHCLERMLAFVPLDPRVGASPDDVERKMSELGTLIESGLAAADKMRVDAQISEKEKASRLVEMACGIFDLFLQVHPYANGNGHAARLIVWALLGRYGHWPSRWPVEPRPPDPPYTTLLLRHRNGDRQPLIEYVMGCLG